MAAEGARERKVVTVLFADLVGFTARAESLDPEDVEAILAPYHARLRSELERFGGTVEKFIGDAVMALFGAPVAHEDDPERAVRAALAIRDWARQEAVEVRIAVNTGEALVRLSVRPEAGEGMAAGDVVNTAARLQTAAPVNGVVVGETTYRATRDRIEYREHDAVEAKGKAEPVPVWEAVQARSRLGMDLEQQSPTPFVGRERELAALVDTFERVSREREPQLVTLVGVPGIGKSRLVAQLFQHLDAAPDLVWWRQGRALPYGEGVSFWALGEMVKAQAGIHENDSEQDAAAKLHESVAHAVAAHDREWITKNLEPLVGLGTEKVDAREAFAAWREYLEALAEQRPLVLVFEDLHWADDGLLDFVDHLSEWSSGVSLLVLGTARPELLDRRPGWGGGKLNASTLALSPLADEDAARVIAGVLDRALLPAETQAALLERAGGNPLYAEQFARLYLERGSVEDLPLPENVQGIIAARLDGLPGDEKRLLQDAAVLGKVFWRSGVHSLTGLGAGELDEPLHALERKGFVRRERRSAVAGEVELAFRHVLVREVAYSQIPRALRVDKHVAAAEWIESLGRPDDHAELVAHHYSTAYELARAAGQDSAELAERARLALRHAGDRAAALGSFAAAAASYRAALELWPEQDRDRALVLFGLARSLFYSQQGGADELRDAVEALLSWSPARAAEGEAVRAELAWYSGAGDEVERRIARALELVDPLPASRSKAWVLSQASRYAMVAARDEEAIGYGRRALALAEQLDLPDVRVHALTTVGVARLNRGDVVGVTDVEAAVELAEEVNSPELARALHNLGVCYTVTQGWKRTHDVLLRAIAAAERFGLAPLRGYSRSTLCLALYRGGRWDEALELCEAQLAGGALGVAERNVRALIRFGRGDADGALADNAAALELGRSVRDPQAVYPPLAALVYVLASLGERDQAYAAAVEFTAASRRLLPVWASAEIVALVDILGSDAVRSWLESLDLPRTAWRDATQALLDEDFARAAAIYDELDGPTDAAFARLLAARRMRKAGERGAADAHLRKALAFYRSVGATRYLREAEALLAAAG